MAIDLRQIHVETSTSLRHTSTFECQTPWYGDPKRGVWGKGGTGERGRGGKGARGRGGKGGHLQTSREHFGKVKYLTYAFLIYYC